MMYICGEKADINMIRNTLLALAYNMNPTYCTENVNNNGLEWYQIVDELKTSVYNSNILDEFTNTKKEGKAIY